MEKGSASRYLATGRRKRATARVSLISGKGIIVVNGLPVERYFSRPVWRYLLVQPLEISETSGQYDVNINVSGGGLSGQAAAARLGISKALLEISPQWRTPLKKEGLLTRDPREKERKKYGQKGARKRFQYSKR